MKKMFSILLFTAIISALPSPAEASERAAFFKNFNNCKPASYTARFDNGTSIKRTVIGAGYVKGIYSCQYSEAYSNNKTLSCSFPMHTLKQAVGAINSGTQEKLFKGYIDNGVCELSE